MRDILLLALLPILIYYALKRPFIGLSLWFWTSLVPIQTWAHGLATEVRWNLLFASCTMLGYFLMKNKPKVQLQGVFWGMLLLLLLATLSSLYHQGFDIVVWDRWESFLKSMVFFVFVYLIVDKKLHVEALMWACVLSVTAVSASQGLKVLASGGNHVTYGISSTFNDNNLSAFAALICIPFLLFLLSQYKDSRIIRYGLIGGIFTNILFILGSDSRGGLVGLVVLFGYYFLKSNKKLPLVIFAVIAGGVGLSLMDASWFERMDTIKNASEDSSFMGRVVAWKLSVLMALDAPILGGGFDAIAYQPTWSSLLGNWQALDFINTAYPIKGHVAHSIYFQVLGDLGFLGFIVFYLIVYKSYRHFKQVRKSLATTHWMCSFASYMLLTFICFLVAGAALSVAYNEIIMMLIAIAPKAAIIVAREQPNNTVPAA
jgi:probable O-glycosylation ligase (exosortase A-associated)